MPNTDVFLVRDIYHNTYGVWTISRLEFIRNSQCPQQYEIVGSVDKQTTLQSLLERFKLKDTLTIVKAYEEYING